MTWPANLLPMAGLLGDGLSRLQGMGSRFQPGANGLSATQWTTILLVFGGGIAVVGLIWLLAERYHSRHYRTYRSPRRLFHELARAHGLSRDERQLLQDIAAWHRLPNEATLFVSPERFQTSELRKALGKTHAIDQLADKLFGPVTVAGRL
ncbi:MAG: hypothetical protein AB7O38_29685 [Pirellulaceae bacterium]